MDVFGIMHGIQSPWGTVNTRSPSLPRGSMTLTATRHACPWPNRDGLGKGRLTRPPSASNAPRSTAPASSSALASRSHLLLSGKNAWQMQKVRPS